MIIVADLCGILLALQAQLLAYELVAEGTPVILWISHMMSIVVTSGTTKLSCNLASLQRLELLSETINVNHDFLAQAGWRCRLTMSLSQHRNILPLISVSLELCNQLLYLWVEALFQSLLHRERHTGIVDVLRCQTEVDKLLVGIQATNLVELFLDEVLNGFHVMVGNLLNVFHTLCSLLVEIAVDVTQTLKQLLVERSQLWQR